MAKKRAPRTADHSGQTKPASFAGQFLHVNGWWNLQHYHRGRTPPPWVKWHARFLEDRSFAALPDAAKAHLMGVWLLAAKLENRIPFDEKFVGNRINATERVDLTALVGAGFLIRCKRDASGPLASCPQCATPETETDTETETESEGETESESEAKPEAKGEADRKGGERGGTYEAGALRQRAWPGHPARPSPALTGTGQESSVEWTERRKREEKAKLAEAERRSR